MTTRPAILRALTDLFTLRTSHTEEDIARYEELAGRIIGDAGPSTLAYVAAKLARHHAAPPAILAELASRDRTCATIIIEHAINLPLEDQISVALGRDAEYAAALARRRGLGGVVTEALISRGDPAIIEALAENGSAQFNRAGAERAGRASAVAPEIAAQIRDRSVEPLTDTIAFLRANTPERARMIAAANRDAMGRKHHTVRADPDLVQRIQDAAQDERWDMVSNVIAQEIGWDPSSVTPLVTDEGGEPLALLMAAIGFDSDEAARIFLCCGESIAHSYARVRTLAEIVRNTPGELAGKLLTEFTGLEIRHRRPQKRGPLPAGSAYLPGDLGRVSPGHRDQSLSADSLRRPSRASNAARPGKTTLVMRRGG